MTGERNIGNWNGCTAVTCVRQMSGKKSYANYLIEERCRYAENNTCLIPKKETKETDAKT